MSPVQKATCGKEETMHQHLNTLYQGQSLTRDAARDAFGQVVRGEVGSHRACQPPDRSQDQGGDPEEIAGAAEAPLAEARDFPRPDYAFCDIVGTGGRRPPTPSTSPPPRPWWPPPAA